MENEIYEKKNPYFPFFQYEEKYLFIKYPPLPSFSLIFGEKRKKEKKKKKKRACIKSCK
jgi:hypothetical protein